eukprot:125288-Rhodomonas_salina.2
MGYAIPGADIECVMLSAYSDHWVSNVQDRVGFLETLKDTLGFVPKVEFNAGVVAAGYQTPFLFGAWLCLCVALTSASLLPGVHRSSRQSSGTRTLLRRARRQRR